MCGLIRFGYSASATLLQGAFPCHWPHMESFVWADLHSNLVNLYCAKLVPAQELIVKELKQSLAVLLPGVEPWPLDQMYNPESCLGPAAQTSV